MLNLPYFNDRLLELGPKEMLPHARVASAYLKLATLMRSTSRNSEQPGELKLAVAAKKHRFAGYAQQDAQEFLTALLELLSLDLNRVKTPKYQELTADLSKHSLQQIVLRPKFSLSSGGTTTNRGRARSYATASRDSSCRGWCALSAGTSRSPSTRPGSTP
jgi:hypothetical protein